MDKNIAGEEGRVLLRALSLKPPPRFGFWQKALKILPDQVQFREIFALRLAFYCKPSSILTAQCLVP